MNQIEEIKAKVDIVEIISQSVSLKPAGRNLKGLCPFHSEKTPSFMVSPELQIFKCFGCGKSGDVITFLQEYERMDFGEALEYLAQIAGVKLERQKYSPDESIKRKIYEINAAARFFYNFLLTKHESGKKALEYAYSRGLDKKIVKEFGIGFSPLKPNALANYLIKKKKYSKDELMQTGIFFTSQYSGRQELLDRFYGRLIFPLLDHRGNIVSFAGRLIPGFFKDEDKRGKYINGPDTPAYHKSYNLYGLWLTKEEIRKADKAVLVEGELDLISSWKAGVKNAVAIKGTALTQEQIQLIKRFASNLCFALDADFAGDQAALRCVTMADKEGLDMTAVILPKGVKDPDELARKDPQKLIKAVERSVPVWDFIINNAIRKYGTDTPQGKKNTLQTVLPVLTQIDNQVVKEDYLKKLSQILNTSSQAVMAEAKKTAISAPKKAKANILDEPQEPQDKQDILEEYVLSLIMLSGKPQDYLDNVKFDNFLVNRIFKDLKKYLKKHNKFSSSAFLSFLSEELKPKLEKMFFVWGDDQGSNLNRELEKTIKELERVKLKKKLNLLSAQISEAERSQTDVGEDKSKKSLEKLQAEFSGLANQLSRLDGD
jgi:DNA primase